jgi:hypothetical protein
MKNEFDEGSLKDLFAKRATLGWTVAQVLWFLEHARVSAWLRENSELVEWVMAHLEVARWVCDNARIVEMIRAGKLPLSPSQIFAGHLFPTTDGNPLKVEEDVWPTVTDATVLRPVSVLRNGDGSWINTDTMCTRALEHNANLGLADAPYLLAHPEKLKAFEGHYIPLPGTKLCAHGFRGVAYLGQDGVGVWHVSFRRVGRDWVGRARFASCELRPR